MCVLLFIILLVICQVLTLMSYDSDAIHCKTNTQLINHNHSFDGTIVLMFGWWPHVMITCSVSITSA
jgi:hypothetical protein